ncbi:MAG TPA: PLP-dependent transferase [Paracoccaceae bacterium]|nr:PLP-dependent transferase [Paracoccaceae bacterium]
MSRDKFGVTIDYVDGSDTEAAIRALPGAALLYLESPTSLVFTVQDIVTLAAAARAEGVLTIIDNSWATPLFPEAARPWRRSRHPCGFEISRRP